MTCVVSNICPEAVPKLLGAHLQQRRKPLVEQVDHRGGGGVQRGVIVGRQEWHAWGQRPRRGLQGRHAWQRRLWLAAVAWDLKGISSALKYQRGA
jgi:hypothetical protein